MLNFIRYTGHLDRIAPGSNIAKHRIFNIYNHVPCIYLGMGRNLADILDGRRGNPFFIEKLHPFFRGLHRKSFFNLQLEHIHMLASKLVALESFILRKIHSLHYFTRLNKQPVITPCKYHVRIPGAISLKRSDAIMP